MITTLSDTGRENLFKTGMDAQKSKQQKEPLPAKKARDR